MAEPVLCSVCGRPAHVIDDPECMPATKPIAEKLTWALQEIERLRVDVKRLDWLDAVCNETLLEFGFEMDGGVYLRIDATGHGGTDIREKNSARAAIDSGMIVAPTGDAIGERNPPSTKKEGTSP